MLIFLSSNNNLLHKSVFRNFSIWLKASHTDLHTWNDLCIRHARAHLRCHSRATHVMRAFCSIIQPLIYLSSEYSKITFCLFMFILPLFEKGQFSLHIKLKYRVQNYRLHVFSFILQTNLRRRRTLFHLV